MALLKNILEPGMGFSMNYGNVLSDINSTVTSYRCSKDVLCICSICFVAVVFRLKDIYKTSYRNRLLQNLMSMEYFN